MKKTSDAAMREWINNLTARQGTDSRDIIARMLREKTRAAHVAEDPTLLATIEDAAKAADIQPCRAGVILRTLLESEQIGRISRRGKLYYYSLEA